MAVKRTWDELTRAAFWRKVAPDERGCWVWTAAARAAGYGTFYVHPSPTHPGGKIAHRLAWMDLVGPIEPGLQLDHLCKNQRCVNPAHLEPVTAAENLRRKKDPARFPPDIAAFPVGLVELRPHARVRHPRDVYTPLCPRGHEYAVTGWVTNGPNARVCAECRRVASAKRRRGGQHGTETHCPAGHPYDATSVRVRPDGSRSRECVICRRARAMARYHARAR